MLFHHIRADDLFRITREVLPDDHLVILDMIHPGEASLKKILRFPSRDAMLDFLAEDMPLVILVDLEDACLLDDADRELGPEPFIALRRTLDACLRETVSPQREGMMRNAIRETADQIGNLYRDKWIEATLDWAGQARELCTAANPFLEEIRAGLSGETGAPPSTEEMLRFLLAHEETSDFYREFLVDVEGMPGEVLMDLTPEELQQKRETLEGWWVELENHPQPFLAAMWRPRYELIRGYMQD